MALYDTEADTRHTTIYKDLIFPTRSVHFTFSSSPSARSNRPAQPASAPYSRRPALRRPHARLPLNGIHPTSADVPLGDGPAGVRHHHGGLAVEDAGVGEGVEQGEPVVLWRAAGLDSAIEGNRG